ncbi:MAG: DNA pilot protein [Microvirus sp.]|nr:MAG: DNA pilot protein [Microvirus sp.]
MSFKIYVTLQLMPFGVAEGVATAAAIGSQIYNQQSTAKSNLRSRQFAEEWNFRQREWALQDWNMQNEYNSPVEQRKRMIAAGMNPALMYGQGGSSGLSAPVRTSPTESWRPQPHQVDGVGQLAAIYDIIRTQAQTNLVNAQTPKVQSENAKLTAWLKGLETYNSLPIDQSEVDSGQYKSTDVPRNYVAEDMWLKNKKAWTDYVTGFGEAARRDLYSSKNAEVVAEKLLLMAAQRATTEAQKNQILENIDLMKKSGKLKDAEIDANEVLNGAFRGPAARILFGILRKVGILK